jgi:hypothetical protein
MNMHPILFSGPMAKAILEGRKTQTRRIANQDFRMQSAIRVLTDTKTSYFDFVFADETGMVRKCPYGLPGDRLWVRETWAAHPTRNKTKPSELPVGIPIWYQQNEGVEKGHFVWRPSIFMPRWASRITLEVENVRVERLKNIERNDAIAEGVSAIFTNNTDHFERGELNPYVANFRILWDSINAQRGFGWDVNPWVWVIEFKRIETEE